ncbi:hypothetical protein V8D89_004403 [Ganoderma adspersum]
MCLYVALSCMNGLEHQATCRLRLRRLTTSSLISTSTIARLSASTHIGLTITIAEVAMHGLPFSNELSVASSSLPAVDRTSFVGLGVPAMRALIAAKSDEYHRYTLALHSMQNVLAPIHRLPAEILSRILVDSWQDRKSLHLTHVCRIWRSLLLDTSQFWTVAIAGDEFRLPNDEKDCSDEEYLVAACIRSAPRSISLRLSSLSSRGHLKLIELADRIGSLQLSIRSNDQLDRLWQALHVGMPRLEDLAICLCVPDEGVMAPHPLSSEKLPLLTRLTLPTRLFLFSWRLNTIQEIALRSDRVDLDSRPSSTISVNLVLTLLEDYPSLKGLEISDDTVVDGRDPRHAVEFSSLERLRIKAFPGNVSAIMSGLILPLSTYIDLEIVSDPPHWDDDDEDEWLYNHSNPMPQPDPLIDNPTLNAIVAFIDQIIIENGPTPTVRGYADGSERLCIRYVSGEWNRSREAELSLTRLFTHANAPVSHLILTTPPRTGHYASLSNCPFSEQVLAAFPRITHLNVRSPNATSILFSLGTARRSYSGRSPSAPFSFLEDLTIGFETPRGHENIVPLRRYDITADVVSQFRNLCGILTTVLADRSQHRRRLSRLEFFSYEEGSIPQKACPVSHIDLAALAPESVEDGLRKLKALVDGPVVFSGYHFFTHA